MSSHSQRLIQHDMERLLTLIAGAGAPAAGDLPR